ncbi:MAG: OmpA family protein [Cyclobacteriaceae bacterium]|nr:OmpA family protein [Cyclobacteriaceae bacterium]
MNRYFWLAVFFFLGYNSFSQQTLGGKINHFVPFTLGDSVNSKYNAVSPVLSPDNNLIFFSRVDHPDNHFGKFDSQDIWYVQRLGEDEWSAPKRVDAKFNNGRYNAIYSITDNWDYLISGVYAKNGRYKKRGLSIVQYDSTLNKWLPPVKVKVPGFQKKDKGLTSSAYLNRTGDILVVSYTKHWQSEKTKEVKISIKKSNGKWGALKNVHNKVAKAIFRSMETPYLSDDGNTLFVSAYLKGKGNVYENDIYRMDRLDGTYEKWSEPELLNDTINTDNWESYYREFDDGNWAVFTRAPVGQPSTIYMVKLKEPRPYIDLSGLVLLEGEPMKEAFKVVINGSVVDSVRIDTVASTYAVRLPLGKMYEIQARAVEREAKLEIIDATEQLEYLKMDRDLQLSLLPFLDLSGIAMVDSIPLTEPFDVIINGQKVDSVRTDSTTGEYSVKLPLGQEYKLYVKSGYYIPDTLTVSVLYDSVQIQMRKNLKVTPTPYVDIYGELVNIKTDSLIPQSASPKFMLDGVVADSIDTSNGTYKIRLPWGHKYTFQIQADEFGPVVATIDLQNVTNYQKILRNIYATPLEKYALVSGKVIDKKTGMPVKFPFLIDVDGSHSTTSELNETNGTYRVRLPLGKKSILTASAEAYFPIAEIVDVTNDSINVELTKDLYIVPLRVGEAILLNNITFESASSTLKGDSFSDMDRVVDLLKAFPGLKIEIGGHTDSSGSDATNLRLSKARAESVAEYILGKGISRDRVVFKGYGESKPVATNLTSAGRAQNRRVEFVVLEL